MAKYQKGLIHLMGYIKYIKYDNNTMLTTPCSVIGNGTMNVQIGPKIEKKR